MNRNGVRNRGIYNYYNNPPPDEYLADWEDYVDIIQNMPELQKWYDFTDGNTISTTEVQTNYFMIDFINNKGINIPTVDPDRLNPSSLNNSDVFLWEPGNPEGGQPASEEFSFGRGSGSVRYLSGTGSNFFIGDIIVFQVLTTDTNNTGSGIKGYMFWDNILSPQDMTFIDKDLDQWNIIGHNKVYKNPDPNGQGTGLGDMNRVLYVNNANIKNSRINLFQSSAKSSQTKSLGKHYEYIVFKGTLSTTNKNLVLDYLELKYGLKEQNQPRV